MHVVFSTSLGIFISDGTPAGTTLITALPNPTGYAQVGGLVSLNGEVLFGYPDGVANDRPSLWLTDGTAAGTEMFITLPDEGLEAYGPPALYDILSLGSRALFTYSPAGPTLGQRWSTDGTAAGTINLSASVLYTSLLDPGGLLANGQFVSIGPNGVDVTDGTLSGSYQLKAGPLGGTAYAFHPTSLGSVVVFGVESGPKFNDASGGDQLWRTDGTLAGTVLVTDLPRFSQYAGMTASMTFGSEALFSYIDGAEPFLSTLWVTDGTAADTFQLPGVTNPQFGAVAGGSAILIAAEGLVATDGTVVGTQVIAPKSLGPSGFGPTTIMASLGNDVIFAAATPTSLNDPYVYGPTNQLWITDGTASGTKLIKAFPTSGISGSIINVASAGDHVFFTFADRTGDTVWTTDGTLAGTSVMFGGANAYGGSVAQLIPPCFAAATRIAAYTGAVTVEKLQIGDAVLTASDHRQVVQWVGHRHVDCRRHPKPEMVWPVRIAPHAFGEERPKCPLFLSPDHSVFVEDVLIPIKFLINDTTIEQLKVDGITYYHVELVRHDVLLAEGLPVESYLETGGRAAFANGGAVTEIHPNFRLDQSRIAMTWEATAYAPLLGNGDQLARTRMKLQLQASMLGSVVAKQRKRRVSPVKVA